MTTNAEAAEITRALIDEARGQMAGCHRKIRHCVEQLSEEQVWHRAGDGFNSIANLVLHLTGNVRQRIGSIIGGEPDVRDRPLEFSERGPIAKSELLARLAVAFDGADAVL